MMRALFLLIPLVMTTLTRAADSANEDKGISELLSYAVPAENWQEHLKKRKEAGWVPPPMPSFIPTADGDIDRLVCYWQADYSNHEDKPDAQVRGKLLAHCEEHPAAFGELSKWFIPTEDDTLKRIQKLYDRLSNSATEENIQARQKVRHWLMTQAGMFRDELKAEAAKYFTTPDDAELQAAFETYQKREPATAQAMLVNQAAAPSPEASCTALLRLHAMQDAQPGPWREGMQKIAGTQTVPAILRARALKALHEADWPGKEAWVLALFSDAALGTVQVAKYEKEEPLTLLVKANPSLWVPKVIPLVGHSNRVVHDNAVRCLLQFHGKDAREDALRALLPWLSDPKWALDDEHRGRQDLLYALDDVNLPECVPGLLWVLEHDSEYALGAAASMLVHYRAVQAVPALKKAIAREPRLYHRKSLAENLLKLEGMSLEERAQAVEQYESLTLTKEGRAALQDEWMSLGIGKVKSIVAPDQRLAVSTGLVLCDDKAFQSPALVEALAKRVEELRQAKKLELAEALESRVSLWSTPASVRLMVARLRAGRVNASWLWDLVTSRDLATAELKRLQDLPANTAAVVALLLHDENRQRQILESGPDEARAMLLACARIKRTPLPLDKVALLLESQHILCARGAERYLEAEDSPQARAMLQRRFKGEARILGARMNFDPGHYSYGELGQMQDMLRKRVLTAKQPLEILAMLSAGYWGDVGQVWIELEGEKAILVNDQGSERYGTRLLTAAELAELRTYVTQNRVDELPPLTLQVNDGVQYEYLHLTANGGRRVFMNNPGTYASHGEKVPEDHNDSVYVCLVKLFEKLVEDKSKLTVAYRMADEVKGLRIVIPRERQRIEAVMKQNGALMVRNILPGDRDARWTAVDASGNVLPKTQATGPALLLHDAGFTEELSVDDYSLNTSWRTAALDGQLRTCQREKDDKNGLWLCRKEQEPQLMAEGNFGTPIASQGGTWAVAARILGASWAEPNEVVRINLATREIIPLKLAPADNFGPVTRLPHSGKILVSRSRDEPAPGIEPKGGPEKPEYYLLDPATGELERVTGEFRPLEDETWRTLQPTGEPHVVWAAVPLLDNKSNKWSTRIGRYDLRTFTFTEIMNIPRLYFTSMDFWVDSKTQTVFLAQGDLLSFPLPEAGRGEAR